MIQQFKYFLNSRLFFWSILFIFLAFYLRINIPLQTNSLSSDVWGYQFLELQSRFNYWENVPPSYNQSELYIAFPLFYFLNPGLEHSLGGYHVMSLVIIICTYIITGLIARKFFGNWWGAALAGIVILIPRFIFSTSIGFLDISGFRGSILVLPFYVLFIYYWTIKGIKKPFINLLLATLAGLLVYLYPPVGTIGIFFCIIVALVFYRFKLIKPLLFFIIVYFIISAPFFLNHLLNPNTKMLDENNLSVSEKEMQSEIVQNKFRGSGFIKTIEFGEIKRDIWDGLPLLITLVASLYFVLKKQDDPNGLFTKISIITFLFFLVAILFIIIIEFLNGINIKSGGSPIFLEHLRSMRIVGAALLFQSVAFIVFLVENKRKKLLAFFFVIVIVLLPIRFSAPLIRNIARMTIPENIRLKYNLAPIVSGDQVLSYFNLKEVALWSRVNLPHTGTNFFVFSGDQRDFIFKILSHLNTNLTNKEGNLWVTSGFSNSKRWYEERQEYDRVVGSATDFRDIVIFAQKLKSTHMLIPRGKISDLYWAGGMSVGEVVYDNSDYLILDISKAK
jgi:hypothetical protein